MPSLIAVIAPVALFAGILYTLNKLNGDSELVVMAAAGVSPARLLRPMAALSVAVFVGVAAIYVQLLPWSFGAIENLTTFVHADFISNFARPGAFNDLTFGFVFHYRERTPGRSVARRLHAGPARPGPYLHLHRGSRQDLREGRRELSAAEQGRAPSAAGGRRFRDGDFRRLHDRPLAVLQAIAAVKRPRERSTIDLLSPSADERADAALAGHIRSELLDRLASPLYALVAGFIAFAALGEARTTRQGRGLAIGGAILAFIVIRGLGIAATTLTVGIPSAAIFVWGIPVAASLGALAMIFRRRLLPARIWRAAASR